MIRITGYHLHSRAFRQDIPVTELEALLKDDDWRLWIDFEAFTDAESELLLSMFHLDAYAVEDCRHPRQTPKLESFDDYHFFIVQGVKALSGTTAIQPLELDGFLSERWFITLHDQPMAAIDGARASALDSKNRLAEGTAYLAYEILDHVIDMYMPILEDCEARVLGLSRQGDMQSFKEQTAEQYLEMTTRLLDLRRISVKNRDVFFAFSHSPLIFISREEARLFRDIYDHVVRVVDYSEYYQHTLRELLEIHLSLNANKVNEVVKFLTIFATIMLPLNVVTGIYGMNFTHMPLLTHPYGFWVTLLLMFGLVGGMLLAFRRWKWL